MLIDKMAFPDLKSPKILLPTMLFFILKTFLRVDHISESLIFGILCYISLKYFTNITLTKADIVIPTVLFFTFPQFNQTNDISTAMFLLEYAFIRLIFPLNK
jgi:hypothetical protein